MEMGDQRRAGRPRDRAAADAILDATLELIAEHGVDDTSTAEIAARAHTGKDTIYRRWAHKDDLVRAALDRLTDDHRLPTPTGSLESDLRAWVTDLEVALVRTALGPILLALAARARHDAEAAAWVARHRERVRGELGAILARHGQGADPAARAAAWLLADTCHARWLLGETPVPDDDAWRAITGLMERDARR